MKRTVSIILHSVNDVKNIADFAKKIDGEVSISSGRYHIDAKSILGIYVLDLSSPLSLEIEKWEDEYEAELKPYMGSAI